VSAAIARIERAHRPTLLGALLVSVVAALGAGSGAAAAASGVTLTPGGPFTDGQAVTVAVGPNSVFTPNAKVNILECADPGGSTANLPTDDSTCDGNTIQGETVIVHGDGSISAPYTIYQLPSSALGEQPNFQPVCNQSSPCVLYVGQDENDFNQPKMLSASFTVAGGAATSTPTTPPTAAGTGTGTGGSSPAAGTPGSSANAGASSGGVPPASGTQAPRTTGHQGATDNPEAAAGRVATASQSGTLAFTGLPAALTLLAAIGALLVLAGVLFRRLSTRADR